MPCDAVLVATPIDLGRLMRIDRPWTRVTYELVEHDPGLLPNLIRETLSRAARRAASHDRVATPRRGGERP